MNVTAAAVEELEGAKTWDHSPMNIMHISRNYERTSIDMVEDEKACTRRVANVAKYCRSVDAEGFAASVSRLQPTSTRFACFSLPSRQPLLSISLKSIQPPCPVDNNV